MARGVNLNMSSLSEIKIEELREKVGYTFYKEKMKDGQGRFWTQGIFKEMSYGKGRDCVMTFKLEDFDDLVSFKRVFVELGDPSGYLPAMVLLESWDHWLKLCDCTWFRHELALAEDELEVKLRSAALTEIKVIAEGASGSALQAAKYLAEGRWKAQQGTSRNIGRPKKKTTKEAQDKDKKITSLIQRETENDYERLGLGQTE